MPRRLLCTLACAAAALAAAPASLAGGGMFVGAAEDASKSVDPVAARAKMDLAELAGFDAIRMTTLWHPAQTAPAPDELLALQNSAAAAQADGIRLILSLYQPDQRTTPLTPAARAQFAAWAAAVATGLPTVTDYIVGNEPNLNLFWMPQFNADGSDAAAPAYEQLLAQTYDALKAVSPAITVIGGSVSPRGQDKANSKRQTHSPTTFIPDLGAAYRASGRTKPIMDELAFHPYGDNSSQPPTFRHPRSTSIGVADYGKLVGLLGEAFDGTAQAGSALPIVYDEYGIDTAIPASETGVYTDTEPAPTHPVSEARQALYYREALTMAACQPTVVGMLIFHVTDESDLHAWQSGLFYADAMPKASLGPVRSEALAVRNGTSGPCRGALATAATTRTAKPVKGQGKGTGGPPGQPLAKPGKSRGHGK